MTPPTLPARKPFLSARWERLCLITYAVDPARLVPWLHPDLTLDVRDGSAFVSLVAFDFMDTRVLGIPWPGYRNFPEVNLRFYVRYGDRRGVVFIREYVPKRLIAWLANGLYNEPYRAAAMHSEWNTSSNGTTVQHELHCGGTPHSIRMSVGSEPSTPHAESTDHFFKEHSWGFGQSRRGRLLQYEVWHPIWATLPVTSLQLNWDFGSVYGDAWADLNDADPHHVAFATGSEIRVYPKTLIG